MSKITISNNRYWVQVNKYYSYPILHGDVLISIRHQYAAQIYAGTKRYELRHNAPSFDHNTTMWIYEPLPVGKITGYVEYLSCIKGNPTLIWDVFRNQLGVTKQEFDNYYKGRKFAYIWRIYQVSKLDEPISLAEIGLTRPPQSYQFLNLSPSNRTNK